MLQLTGPLGIDPLISSAFDISIFQTFQSRKSWSISSNFKENIINAWWRPVYQNISLLIALPEHELKWQRNSFRSRRIDISQLKYTRSEYIAWATFKRCSRQLVASGVWLKCSHKYSFIKLTSDRLHSGSCLDFPISELGGPKMWQNSRNKLVKYFQNNQI